MPAYDNVKVWTVDPTPRPTSRSPSPRSRPETGKGAPRTAQRRDNSERNARIGVWARLAVVALLSGTILWWPYGRSCGLGLALYLISTAMIIVGGVWVAGRTWTLRMSRTHVLAMLVSLWGIGLVALAALPHTGLGRAGTTTAAAWSCAGR